MVSLFQTIISAIVSFLTMIEMSIGVPFNDFNFRIEIPATVFETGNDMYTVIWTTNKRGTGKVTYTYDGKEFVVNDQVGGNIRCMDTIHSVRVPKKHLDNNTYSVSSQYVPYKGGYKAVKGKTVSSDPIKFSGYNGQEQINVLALSDIHNDINPAKKAIKNFSATPDIIILNGDIVSTMENKSAFETILRYTGELSGGCIPTVYVRGNHEPRGEYASEMMQYFKTETGNLYFTFNYGPVWSVVLDCGEDKPDDHVEYSGLVDFSSYIAGETSWLESLVPDDNETTVWHLAITHNPDIANEYGNNWTGALENLGTDICLSGHFHRLELNFREGSAGFNRIITGGRNDKDSTFIATMITFSGNTADFLSIDDNGVTRGERRITK